MLCSGRSQLRGLIYRCLNKSHETLGVAPGALGDAAHVIAESLGDIFPLVASNIETVSAAPSAGTRKVGGGGHDLVRLQTRSAPSGNGIGMALLAPANFRTGFPPCLPAVCFSQQIREHINEAQKAHKQRMKDDVAMVRKALTHYGQPERLSGTHPGVLSSWSFSCPPRRCFLCVCWGGGRQAGCTLKAPLHLWVCGQIPEILAHFCHRPLTLGGTDPKSLTRSSWCGPHSP